MSLEDELETLRAAVPGCRVAAFVDLRAQLVLLSKAAQRPKQEWLDRLARTGATLLPLSASPLMTAAAWDGALPDEAAVISAEGLRIYARLPEDLSEALCCDCAPGADAGAVLAAARATLRRIVAAG